MTTKSFARWPAGTCPSDNDVTSDTHTTAREAIAVCRLLDMNGYAGEGKIFPIETWIEEDLSIPFVVKGERYIVS